MNTMFQNNQNSSMISQFNNFKNDLLKSGQDPAQILNNLVSSGKVSQQQLNQAKMLAQLFMKNMNK